MLLRYRDMQVSEVAHAVGYSHLGQFTEAQRSQGIELLPGWKVIASYAYIDAEVTKDNIIPIGNRVFNVPENQASL